MFPAERNNVPILLLRLEIAAALVWVTVLPDPEVATDPTFNSAPIAPVVEELTEPPTVLDKVTGVPPKVRTPVPPAILLVPKRLPLEPPPVTTPEFVTINAVPPVRETEFPKTTVCVPFPELIGALFELVKVPPENENAPVLPPE